MIANDNTPPARTGRLEKTKRTCPICGKPRHVRYNPFCSRRCADVDLHRWLKGSYVVPGRTTEPGEENE
jgi:endogenous inhibitor of DNA gyrase (YacG/DUF329 family)